MLQTMGEGRGKYLLPSIIWKSFELGLETIRSNAWRMGVQGNQEAKYEMKMLLGAFDM